MIGLHLRTLAHQQPSSVHPRRTSVYRFIIIPTRLSFFIGSSSLICWGSQPPKSATR
ncbi:hypothetical protein HanXRQr2_Chr02g0082051 [Helianthus annuus]|uniref:Uncharacterized protein n=1 Tax=Helianthus annuus TaxID=4232 RepID=A0A9K3P069_HELAN|nr:hypothetical protein HanXRQr2_Chr02g0082051 [Helianthus annuus]KAJ0571127.1 hypothetical protein HanHA300_Chr05g0186031 [Helianthus annuus]KAJ0619939.1 hypothetical protein HanHA89_Chr02g0076881 [Helianthus annuus]KAJ0721965.1 hypothetical protein HanOQP8_Chr08g0281331 [Helianthus annuus]KAJ0777653.1 hypothetical protein HanLR1_Chr02g0062951 [Helianthus annuus]